MRNDSRAHLCNKNNISDIKNIAFAAIYLYLRNKVVFKFLTLY